MPVLLVKVARLRVVVAPNLLLVQQQPIERVPVADRDATKIPMDMPVHRANRAEHHAAPEQDKQLIVLHLPIVYVPKTYVYVPMAL